MAKIKLENEKVKKQNLLKHNLNYKNQIKMKYKYQNLNSERVICPEKDTEIEKKSKKRTYENSKFNLFNVTAGGISSLFKRTPLIIKHKGRKILNNSVDYGRNLETDLFSDTFLNDKKYDRIPGVARKKLWRKY